MRARLLAGMLIVTAAGLLITGVVSAIALQRHLTRQQDDRLIEAINRQVDAKAIAPPTGKWQNRSYSAPFIVIRLKGDGTTQVLSGAKPSPGPAVTRIRRLGRTGLAPAAESSQPFDLSADLRATARHGFPGSGDIVVIAAPPGDVEATVRNLVITELITGLALITALGLGGRWLISRGLRPLSRMATTAQAIATGGDLSARMPRVPSRTETGQLSDAINLMLDQIEQAFTARVRSEEKVRAFAADASHELRTPLTTIIGYSQLVQQGAIPPAALPGTLRRIEDESRRMSTLVSELLELARLDRGAALSPAPVDLAELVRAGVADARAVEPSRQISISAPDALVAIVDETRIRQVLANLLGNLRCHTPASAQAVVRLTRDRGQVVLEVSDSGPGMAPRDAERAFDRFHRAPRQGGGTGSGLGLAIVAAIAEAHGGQATLISEPGHGTTVRIELSS